MTEVKYRLKATHEAADAFWKRWEEVGKTGKKGYYEATWAAINAAIRVAGIEEVPALSIVEPAKEPSRG
jgi:hypothetical protein